MTIYRSIKVTKAISKSRLPDIDYALNPYIGCEHSCIYCYSPDFTSDREVAYNWGLIVVAKENIANILEEEVKKLKKGIVGVSTITDPYQPVEAKMELTRKCLKILVKYGFKISIQTKSTLVLRDSDIVNSELFDIGVTITTMRDDIAYLLEPNAPPPESRVKILEYYSRRGIETWLFLGPIIPKVNDSVEQLEEVVKVAAEVGSYIIYDKLNIKPTSLSIMRRKWPFKVELKEVVRLSQTREYYEKIVNIMSMLSRKYKVKCVPSFKYKFSKSITDFLK